MHHLIVVLLTLATMLPVAAADVEPATEGDALDLTLDPAEVVGTPPPVPGRQPAIPGRSRIPERVPGVAHPDRGWSFRPEADADLRAGDDDGGGGSSLNDIELELESLGLRLQRTW